MIFEKQKKNEIKREFDYSFSNVAPIVIFLSLIFQSINATSHDK